MLNYVLVVSPVSYLDPLYNKYVVGSKEKKLQELKAKVDTMSNAEVIDNMSVLNELYQLESIVLLEGFWDTAKKNMVNNKCTNIGYLNEKLNVKIVRDGFIKDNYFYPTPVELCYADEIEEIQTYIRFLIEDNKFSKELNAEDKLKLYLVDPIYGYVVGAKERKIFKLQNEIYELKHSRKKYTDNISKMADYKAEINKLEKEISFSGFWAIAIKNMLEGKRPEKEMIEYIEKEAGIKIYKYKFKKDGISHIVPEELWYAAEVEEIIKYVREIDLDYFINNSN